MTRWPRVRIWQSLDRIDRSTLNESWATVARMPGTLLAAMATPMPVPQTKIARSASPAAIFSCRDRHRGVGGPLQIFLESHQDRRPRPDHRLACRRRSLPCSRSPHCRFQPTAGWDRSCSLLPCLTRRSAASEPPRRAPRRSRYNQSASETAPGSGVPTLRSASGRALPIFGTQ